MTLAGPAFSGPAEQACFEGPDKETRGLMHVNLDGFGQNDKVWVGARRVDGKCKYFLEADTDLGLLKRRIRLDPFDKRRAAQELSPIVIAGIDDRPGKEIFVRIWRGAPLGGARFFTVNDGHLNVMRLETGLPTPGQYAFPYGGSDSGRYAVDCSTELGPNGVVHSGATPRKGGRWWKVHRVLFESIEGNLYRDGELEKRIVRSERIAEHFPEFDRGEGPLMHCNQPKYGQH